VNAVTIPQFPFSPHSGQIQFLASKARFKAASAAVRSGKSTVAAVDMVQAAYNDLSHGHVNPVRGEGKNRRPAWHGLVVAPTYSMLAEPKRLVFETVGALKTDWYEAGGDLWLQGNILISFRSGDDPSKLEGLRLNGAWLDEVTSGIAPDLWAATIRQRLADFAPHSRAWFTSKPEGGPAHWFHREIVRRGTPSDPTYDPNYSHHTWTTAINPRISLDEIEASRAELPDRIFRSRYLASWEAPADGRVFEDWDPSLHIVSETAAKLRYGIALSGRSLRSMAKDAAIGFDPGFRGGAAVVLLDYGDEILAVEEHTEAGLQSWADDERERSWASVILGLKNRWQASTVIVDSEFPEMISQLLRRGLNATGAQKGPGSVRAGLLQVRSWLHPHEGQPRLRVLENCKQLVADIEAASWIYDKRNGWFVDGELNESIPSHCADAMRYALHFLVQHKPVTPRRFMNRMVGRSAGVFGGVRRVLV